jgi:cardiolipin synthase
MGVWVSTWVWVPLLVLAGLAACSRLPVIVPDLAQPSGPPLQLAGRHGRLSPAQSQQVLARLQGTGQATDIFSRHLALEEAIADNPLTTGNQVQLLQDGPATYQAMFDAIQGAQDHIHLETYILDDDEVGRRFAQALVAKQQAGVAVGVIRDSVGTLGTPKAFFQQLTDSGAQVLEFNPLNPLLARKEWELNQRDHRKLLIVDGRTAFLGGINISSVYSSGSFQPGSRAAAAADGPRWRDTDVQVQGPVVADLQRLFLATWLAQKGPPLAIRNDFPVLAMAGQQVVRVIASSPDEPFSQIYATLLSAIDSAETSIHLTNAYFVPDPQLLAALGAAARRGVDVSLILPSQSDSWLVLHAGRNHYEGLLQAGVKIYERHGAILHAKTALIDGVWTTIGSTNLDWRSFLHNHELNVVVLGADFGGQVQRMFDKDLAESDAITLVQWRQRPWQQRLQEVFARLWAYWL